jgi:hypothetical protein
MFDLLGISEPKAIYSNSLDFLGNPLEIRIAFSLSSPTGTRHKVAEIILAPIVAKALARILPERIKDWEQTNGFINMPEDKDLLESLFQVKLRPGPIPPDEEPPSAD